MPQEALAKAHASCRGKPLSAEHKAKISAALRGKPHKTSNSPEARANRSAGQKRRFATQAVSAETRAKLSQPGSQNPAWKGGVDTVNKNDRKAVMNRYEYQKWRKEVFARDHNACTGLGPHEGRLHAHHIKDYHNFPELRFDVDNGRTLCEACHKHIKHYGGNHRAK
jgi:hypothetical protein